MSDAYEDWLDALGFARGGVVHPLKADGSATERWQTRGEHTVRRVRSRSNPAVGLPRDVDRKVLLSLLEIEQRDTNLGEPDFGLNRLADAVRERGSDLGRQSLLASLHRLCALRLHVTTFIPATRGTHAILRPPFAPSRTLRLSSVWSSSPIRWLRSEVVPTRGREMWYSLRLDPLFAEKERWEGAAWTDVIVPPEHGEGVLP